MHTGHNVISTSIVLMHQCLNTMHIYGPDTPYVYSESLLLCSENAC